MQNLEIISTQVTVQAKQVINGNTVNFSWNHNQGELPTIVNFNVHRGVIGEPTYTGNQVISGAFYTDTEKFDVNNNNFQEGDFTVYQEVLTICKSIVAEIQSKKK